MLDKEVPPHPYCNTSWLRILTVLNIREHSICKTDGWNITEMLRPLHRVFRSFACCPIGKIDSDDKFDVCAHMIGIPTILELYVVQIESSLLSHTNTLFFFVLVCFFLCVFRVVHFWMRDVKKSCNTLIRPPFFSLPVTQRLLQIMLCRYDPMPPSCFIINITNWTSATIRLNLYQLIWHILHRENTKLNATLWKCELYLLDTSWFPQVRY